MIKFKLVDESKSTILPRRGTECSAGYDFFAPCDIAIPPKSITDVIWTNIKALMPRDIFLDIRNRSSLMRKRINVYCSGIIDADYYDNEDTGGNIGVAFENKSNSLVIIKKGEKMCQGIFLSYYVTSDDACHTKRRGGFGSTGV